LIANKALFYKNTQKKSTPHGMSKIHRLFLATKLHKESQRKEDIINHPNEIQGKI
jgi:hypothetical protein